MKQLFVSSNLNMDLFIKLVHLIHPNQVVLLNTRIKH